MERFEELFPKPTELEWHHASIFSAGDLWKIRKAVWEAALSRSAGPTACRNASDSETLAQISELLMGYREGRNTELISRVEYLVELENSRSAPDREALKESLRETLAELKWILRYGSAQRIEPPQATQQVIAEAEKRLAESPSVSAPQLGTCRYAQTPHAKDYRVKECGPCVDWKPVKSAPAPEGNKDYIRVKIAELELKFSDIRAKMEKCKKDNDYENLHYKAAYYEAQICALKWVLERNKLPAPEGAAEPDYYGLNAPDATEGDF